MSTPLFDLAKRPTTARAVAPTASPIPGDAHGIQIKPMRAKALQVGLNPLASTPEQPHRFSDKIAFHYTLNSIISAEDFKSTNGGKFYEFDANKLEFHNKAIHEKLLAECANDQTPLNYMLISAEASVNTNLFSPLSFSIVGARALGNELGYGVGDGWLSASMRMSIQGTSMSGVLANRSDDIERLRYAALYAPQASNDGLKATYAKFGNTYYVARDSYISTLYNAKASRLGLPSTNQTQDAIALNPEEFHTLRDQAEIDLQKIGYDPFDPLGFRLRLDPAPFVDGKNTVKTASTLISPNSQSKDVQISASLTFHLIPYTTIASA